MCPPPPERGGNAITNEDLHAFSLENRITKSLEDLSSSLLILPKMLDLGDECRASPAAAKDSKNDTGGSSPLKVTADAGRAQQRERKRPLNAKLRYVDPW